MTTVLTNSAYMSIKSHCIFLLFILAYNHSLQIYSYIIQVVHQGIGLSILSGQHQVGCVDMMPLCKGDDSGLLFYPIEANLVCRY